MPNKKEKGTMQSNKSVTGEKIYKHSLIIPILLPLLFNPLDAMEKDQPAQIRLDYLKNNPEYIATCAQWSFREWGRYTPKKTLQNFIESRFAYLNDDILPLTLIACDGNTPIGMCSLAKNRGICYGLEPWLSALYVIPGYRGRGIGGLLEKEICKKAREMGYHKIYCFTSNTDTVSWYEKHNWCKKSTERQHDHEVIVMEKDLMN
jgi:GNAT superfamily N-acetyltransferase